MLNESTTFNFNMISIALGIGLAYNSLRIQRYIIAHFKEFEPFFYTVLTKCISNS